MCEDTKAADQITRRLNGDSIFKELNGKTVNLHTNLKGRIKNKKIGGQTIKVFEENEKQISDEDLKEIRRISRELDGDESPYSCIVSVLMLREGWDVRNVTTIVPLRPYSSKANILPEQTLGRGLRRMTPPGGANELVTVVEHRAFTSLYEQELEQEGLPIESSDADKVPTTTVSIFPDPNKDWNALDILLPPITAAHELLPKLEDLSIEDVKNAARRFRPLPLGDKGATEVEYVGRHLFTDEVVEQMNINLPLLKNGITAISFYVRELENVCKVQSTHVMLAPLLQIFLGEILFGEKVGLTDSRLTARLADQDVREHIRAVFIPLIRARTVQTQKRRDQGEAVSLRHWKSFQVTNSERRPAISAKKTLFNLVPCNLALEVGMATFLDSAPDVAAFAKNAGSQALRVDYLTAEQRLAFYTPDFFVRMDNGNYYLLETKGRQDRDVPRKASAAVQWCETASKRGIKWEYVFTPQDVMERLTSNRFDDLVRACEPALINLLSETTQTPELPFFAAREETDVESFFSAEAFGKLTERGKKAARDALDIYRFLENKRDTSNFSPVFTSLLSPFDDACKAMVLNLLEDKMPASRHEQERWFDPYLDDLEQRPRKRYQKMAESLKRGLVYRNPLSVIGLLRSCFDYALNDNTELDGVFAAIRESFRLPGARNLLERITKVNDFRNAYVAHSDKELTDKNLAELNLKHWVESLALLRL